MTVTDVKNFRPEVVVIPIGSTEPHGPHLPYGTDTIITDRVSREAVLMANRRGARVLRLPPLPFGNNVNFKGLPFSCRIRVETLMSVLWDLVTFLVEEGIVKIVIFNAHGGNDATVAASLRQIFDRFQNRAFVGACNCGDFSGKLHRELFSDRSPHAGEYETSLMQFVAPEAMPETPPLPGSANQPSLSALRDGTVKWVRNWAHLMPESFTGRPDLASAEKGGQFFATEVEGLSRFLTELSGSDWHERFPYSEEAER